MRIKTVDELARRLECARKFKDLWSVCIQSLGGISTQLSNWSNQRFIKLAHYHYNEEFNETNKLLEDSLNQAMGGDEAEGGQDVEGTSLDDDDNDNDDIGGVGDSISAPSFGQHTKIRFTSDAVKLIKQGDAKYVSFFAQEN